MNDLMHQTVDSMMGFFKTKAITAALELKIFDHLVDGPLTEADLIAKTGLPELSFKRLLIALTAMGLITKENGEFTLPEAHREFLVSSEPLWIGWLARHIDTFLYPLWDKTADAVRTDSNQREPVFGDNRSWFDILYQNPEDVTDFQEFLGIYAKPFIDGFVAEYPFNEHKRFLDIGSGIGSLPMAVADAHPDLEIGICDLPAATAFLNDKLTEKGYGDRIEVTAGDVIEGKLPEEKYDLVHLGWMLHDYDHDIQVKVLENVYNALPVGGKFIASETPLNDDETGPEFTALLSINMLVSTDGGIESTHKQYIDRFSSVGFKNVRALEISGPRTLFIGEK